MAAIAAPIMGCGRRMTKACKVGWLRRASAQRAEGRRGALTDDLHRRDARHLRLVIAVFSDGLREEVNAMQGTL